MEKNNIAPYRLLVDIVLIKMEIVKTSNLKNELPQEQNYIDFFCNYKLR